MGSDALIYIKDNNGLVKINESMSSGAPTVLYFSAPWCGPCKVAGPQYEKFADQYKDKAKFFKIDVDDAGDVAQEYGIAAMPTFIVGDKNGNIGEKIVGAKIPDVENQLKKALEA